MKNKNPLVAGQTMNGLASYRFSVWNSPFHQSLWRVTLPIGALVLLGLLGVALKQSIYNQRFFFILLFLCLCIPLGIGMAIKVSGVLTAGARVLRSACAPHVLWRAWLRQALLSGLKGWLVLMVVCFALLDWAWPYEGALRWSGLALAALVSLTMGVALWWSLAAHSALRRGWSWVIGLVCLAGLGYASYEPGWVAVLTAFSAWPAMSHAGLVLVWPGAMGALWRIWRQPPLVQQTSREPVGGLLRRVQSWQRRYTWVNPKNFKLHFTGAPNISLRWVFLSIWGIQTLLLGPPPQQADISLNSWRLMLLAILVLVMSMHLVGKDLHWRRLLSPGGFQPDRIGTYIFFSTLRFASVHAIPAMVTLGLRWYFQTPQGGVWAMVHLSITTAIEVVCLLSLAVVASSLSSQKVHVVVFFVICITLTSPLSPYVDFILSFWPVAFSPIYLLTLLLITALNITLANRLWTVEKLMRYVRA